MNRSNLAKIGTTSRSIKLHIELPFQHQSCHPAENTNLQTNDNEITLTPRSIHLHINIDSSGGGGGSRRFSDMNSTKKHHQHHHHFIRSRCDTTTSGYSSSSGLSSSSSTHSLNSNGDLLDMAINTSSETSFLMTDVETNENDEFVKPTVPPPPLPTLYTKLGQQTRQSVSNCYDKLSYVPTQQQQQQHNNSSLTCSLVEHVDDDDDKLIKHADSSIVNSSITKTSSSSSPSSSNEDVENIYEEISSFLESNGHLYVNQPKSTSILSKQQNVNVNNKMSSQMKQPNTHYHHHHHNQNYESLAYNRISAYENLTSFGSSSITSTKKPSISSPMVKSTPTVTYNRPPTVELQQLNQRNQPTSLYSNHQQCQQSASEMVNQSVAPKYRREYTLNEIFENLKKFKRQAKEQEMLCGETYGVLNQQQNGTTKTLQTSTRHSQMMSNNHVYVNQRNVSNATFV